MPVKGFRSGNNHICGKCGKEYYACPSRKKTIACSKDCLNWLRGNYGKNEDKIISMYKEGKSLSFLCRVFKTDRDSIKKLIKHQGIKIRGISFYSTGERNGHYKGGHITKYGYRRINGRLEHRWIMEKLLNRKLKYAEHVHHLNGNKIDNRKENLALLSPFLHGGHHAQEFNSWKKMYTDRIAHLEFLLSKCKCSS